MKQKSGRKVIEGAVDPEIFDAWEEFCTRTGRAKGQTLNKVVKLFLRLDPALQDGIDIALRDDRAFTAYAEMVRVQVEQHIAAVLRLHNHRKRS